jgi:DHA2 family multidrug resistance protein
VEDVTPFNNALQMPDVHRLLDTTTAGGRALLDAIVTRQATLIGYLNDYKLLMVLTLATIPLIFIITSARKKPSQEELDEAAVLE